MGYCNSAGAWNVSKNVKKKQTNKQKNKKKKKKCHLARKRNKQSKLNTVNWWDLNNYCLQKLLLVAVKIYP